MSELSILQAFVKAGMTLVGACAMGGNIQAESGFKSNIAQRGMTKLSDEEYTKAADTWSIDFADDGVGYGLCQWTYPTRKAALLGFAIDRGKSVGDEQMQVDFCVWEIQHTYPDLWGYLCMAQDLSGSAGRICTEYERPAINNIETRARYATDLYIWYADKLATNAQGALESIKDVGCVGEQGVCGLATQCRGKFMPVIKRYDDSAEVRYLASKLSDLGYQVLWDGLLACLIDYQTKMGLEVDGICGEKTWEKLLK